MTRGLMPRKVLSNLSLIFTYSTADQDKQPPLTEERVVCNWQKMSVNDRKKPSNFVKLLVVQAAGMFLMLFPPLVLVARQKVATPGATSGAGAWAAGGGDPQMEERSCNCSGT